MPLTNESKHIYDIEWVDKPSILLKNVGRYCQCGKHIFGSERKTHCSKRCAHKQKNERYRGNQKNILKNGMHAFISLKKSNTKIPYRTIKVYLKKGIVEEIKITPEAKELWALLEMIDKFRNKPLEVRN